MNVKDTVLTLYTNAFDEELKTNRLPSIISSTANKMKTICGDSLYAEYKKLPADIPVTDIDYFDTGKIELTIGAHSFASGDYIYFTGSNSSYVGDCIVDSVTSNTIIVYYAFDNVDLDFYVRDEFLEILADENDNLLMFENSSMPIPPAGNLYIVSSKKYDLITAEAYLVMCNLTIMLEEIRNYTPFSSSTDFGEGRVYSASNEAMAGKRSDFMAEARKLIGKYYVEDDNASYSVKFGSFKGSDTWQ